MKSISVQEVSPKLLLEEGGAVVEERRYCPCATQKSVSKARFPWVCRFWRQLFAECIRVRTAASLTCQHPGIQTANKTPSAPAATACWLECHGFCRMGPLSQPSGEHGELRQKEHAETELDHMILWYYDYDILWIMMLPNVTSILLWNTYSAFSPCALFTFPPRSWRCFKVDSFLEVLGQFLTLTWFRTHSIWLAEKLSHQRMEM